MEKKKYIIFGLDFDGDEVVSIVHTEHVDPEDVAKLFHHPTITSIHQIVYSWVPRSSFVLTHPE